LTNINDIYKEMQERLDETDEDAAIEAKEKHEPFDKNMKSLLECNDLENYLVKYEEMNKEDEAVLKCFNLDTTEELKTYIQEKEISFEELKAQTVQASCEALKFAIYDSEEEDDY
jgi:hypothetical protein